MRAPADETFVPPPGRTSVLSLTVAVAGLLVLTGLGQGAVDSGETADAIAVPAATGARAGAAARPAAAPAAAAEERRQGSRSEDAERDRLLRLIILFHGGGPPYGFFK